MSTPSTDSATKASSNNLNRQLGLYSLAAAAAGVSMLALAQPAAGEVVITRKTIPIPLAPYGVPEPVEISLTNNGIDDFTFSLRSTFSSISTLNVRSFGVTNAAAGKGVVGMGTHIAYASALTRGAKIGPSTHFSSEGRIEQSLTRGRPYTRYLYGKWGGNPKNHYLGVRFLIDGQTHYGWIRLTVTTNPQTHGPLMSATITAYAYETVPNKPILAGTAEKPTAEVQLPENFQNQDGPSLGMLAAGADGLPLWRREETLTSR
jgi:hypothetical protein